MAEDTDQHPASRVHGLSKSKITTFEQCPKKLWLSVHRPDLAEADETSELRFAAGHEVGAIACGLHPGGVMVEAKPDLAAAIARTQALIAGGHQDAIFEATFVHDGVLVRVDVMTPDGAGGWRIAEVKSSTGVKSYHIGDLATQVWVLKGAGVNLTGSVIRHVDNRFVLRRKSDYAGLFADAEVDELVAPLIEGRGAIVAEARRVLAGEEPVREIGPHCEAPFACEFASYCGKDAPPGPEWPIALLPNTGRKLAEAFAVEGVHDLTEVEAGALENPVHERIRQATISGTVFHDREAAVEVTKGWAYPRCFLDFETIAFAAPRWVGTRPYQNIPFQFSCQVEQDTGALGHHGFLSQDGRDPRRACAEALIQACGQMGAVIAYNASFERRCVQDLAAGCPDLAPELLNIASRIVDLLPVTRASWYHRDQRGSWSIKAVLPTVAPELDYGALEVGDGVAAQLAWLEMISEKAPPQRKAELAGALEIYCGRDTVAMVVLLHRLVGG